MRSGGISARILTGLLKHFRHYSHAIGWFYIFFLSSSQVPVVYHILQGEQSGCRRVEEFQLKSSQINMGIENVPFPPFD